MSIKGIDGVLSLVSLQEENLPLPLLKIVVLLYLSVSVQSHSPLRESQRTRPYRLVELVGRWPMVDIFVVVLSAALLQVGALATMEPGVGAIAFTSVVLLSTLVAMCFDPRLIWDHEEARDDIT